MRGLAFCLLTLAAFDVPLPWLDRAGVAALGLAFLALSLPRRPRFAKRKWSSLLTPSPLESGSASTTTETDLPERLEAYSLQ